jgi:molybdate transport system ATP-binding protein
LRAASALNILSGNVAVLMARVTAKSVDRLALAPGRPVYAVVKSVSFERS